MSSSLKHYKTIERLPVALWEKIQETGDKRYLLILDIDGYYDLPEVENTTELELAWVKIEEEWLEEFGFSEVLAEITKQRRQITILNARRVIQNNPALQTIINIKQKELEAYLEENVKNKGKFFKFEEQVVVIEKWIGHSIEPYTCPTKKFHTYLRMYKNEVQQKIKHGKANN